MPAVALVIVIFLFWAVVGQAVMLALHTRRNLLQSTLLSPAVGMALTVLLVVWANSAGAPIRYGGPAASVVLVSLVAYLHRRQSLIVPARSILPFACALGGSLLALAYPMFRFGFNWISFANNDMANYCLGAKLFLNRGKFDMPSAQEILGGRDASILYWPFYVVTPVRHGAEDLLAWLASCTGLSPHQAYMPLMLALHLVLIAAATGFVLQSKRDRQAALLTCLALGLSSLTALGTLYQLVSQVGGLALLAACCALLLRRSEPKGVREWLLGGTMLSAMAIYYPEVVPFFVIPFVLYHAFLVLRRRESLRNLVADVWPIAGFTCVLLNVSLPVAVLMLVYQSSAATQTADPHSVMFPQYLTPAGFAYLWGFFPIGKLTTGGTLDIAIVAGGILLLFLAVAVVRQMWRGQPAAFVVAVMAILAVQLFAVRSDFGLFKIAMYIQPFAIGVMAAFWCCTHKSTQITWIGRVVRFAPVVLCLGYGMSAHVFYTLRSLGSAGSFVEIPDASEHHLLSELRDLKQGKGEVISDTASIVLAKYEAAYVGTVHFPVKDFFAGYVAPVKPIGWNPFHDIYGARTEEISKKRASQFAEALFDMHGALPTANRFLVRLAPTKELGLRVLQSNPGTGIMNQRSSSGPDRYFVREVPAADLKNYLVFVASEFGNSNYILDRDHFKDRPLGRVSMYQPEKDYFFPDRRVVSLGRDSLFRILNPSRQPRFVLEYTASLNSDGDNTIPTASVIGDQRLLFSVEGRGSARLFSRPVHPQEIRGGSYVAIDMGTWGSHFPERRSKLLSLFGTDVQFDARRITGFAREISLISDDEYRALEPPRALASFPRDLKNPAVEYSGVYEDGWVAEASYVVLEQPPDASLKISVVVPNLADMPKSIIVHVDDQEVLRSPIVAGTTSVVVPVAGSGRRRVHLLFERVARLPDPDGRPVSARIRYLGFSEKL